MPIWNANQGSFIDPCRLESYYPRIARLVRQRGLTSKSFGATDDSDLIPVEIFDEKTKEQDLTQLHYFLSTYNGSISKHELEDFLKADRMDKVLDNVQRRKRRHIDQNLQRENRDQNLSEQIVPNVDQIYPKTSLMDKFREKIKQHRSEYLPQFRLFDHNTDGYVEKPEFMKFAHSSLGFETGASSKIFDTLAKGKQNLTFNDLARQSNPAINPVSTLQPSGEYTKRLAAICSAAVDRQHTERIKQEQSEKPHILRPAMSTRSSANPSYLFADTFASVMARRDDSLDISRRNNGGKNSMGVPKEGGIPNKKSKRMMVRPPFQTENSKPETFSAIPDGSRDICFTTGDSRSKQSSLMRNYELRVQLLETSK